MNIRNEILSLKKQHYYCEDGWYSCPMHPEGCLNENELKVCTCGADYHNKRVDELVQEFDTFINHIIYVRDCLYHKDYNVETDLINEGLKRITS